VEDFEHAGHRVVVKRDVAVITCAQREKLRPSAVGVLGGEEVIESALDRGAMRVAAIGDGEHAAEENELRVRRAVVDRRHLFVGGDGLGARGGLGVGRERHLAVFRPATVGELI